MRLGMGWDYRDEAPSLMLLARLLFAQARIVGLQGSFLRRRGGEDLLLAGRPRCPLYPSKAPTQTAALGLLGPTTGREAVCAARGLYAGLSVTHNNGLAGASEKKGGGLHASCVGRPLLLVGANEFPVI